MSYKLEDYIKANYHADFNLKRIGFPIQKKFAKKGQIIYPYHKTGNSVYFLNSGMIEVNFQSGAKEKTISFYLEGSFFGPISSLLTNKPSKTQAIAISDCEIEEIAYKDIVELQKKSLLANKIGRIEIEKYYLKKHQRETEFLTQNTQEIYRGMFSHSKEIIKCVPIKKIANYLGVNPETLSRIRNKSFT